MGLILLINKIFHSGVSVFFCTVLCEPIFILYLHLGKNHENVEVFVCDMHYKERISDNATFAERIFEQLK